MTSYIPKQPKHPKDRIEAKLDLGLIQKLERYCAYLDSDRDYVISQALEIAFKKDKGFGEWLTSQKPAGPVESPALDAAPRERQGRKPRPARPSDQNSRSAAAGAAAENVASAL
jgi:hypothetical protein